jgi:hypothetical protein
MTNERPRLWVPETQAMYATEVPPDCGLSVRPLSLKMRNVVEQADAIILRALVKSAIEIAKQRGDL